MPIKEQHGSPTYHVGDAVIVAAKPYYDCPFTWATVMDEYCNKVATITDVYWSEDYETYKYSISIDNGQYAWCANCFTRAEPDADFEISSEDYADILALN